MDQSAVKNRLDQLVGARLARLKIAQGHLYWGITDAGRRYVMEREHKLSNETANTDPQPQRPLIASRLVE